jgi:CRP/FNR family transcriptional regulator, cyclic AMP receptor protein
MLGKLEALRQVPFLRQLDEETLQAIRDRCIEKTYFKNETLFLEGETAKGLIVVWRGSVKIYKTSEQGREQILAVEGPGRSVAELPLFDGLPYPASCAAIEDAVVLLIPAPDFQRLLGRHPELTRAVIASLAFRLRRMVGLVQELSLKAVRERLASLILELAGDTDSVDLPWTHQEIAARIGTVREIVSRTLGKMVQDGAIRLDGRTVVILDRDRL